jgi:hypothetical protein
MASLDDEQFDQALVMLYEPDFTTLRTLMGDRFLIANWQADLMEYASDELAATAGDRYLPRSPASHSETLKLDTDPLSL